VIAGARYRHTNLVARDWRALVAFYVTHFGCIALPPERDLFGADFERGTGIAGARARGIHLALPGTDVTLEIFEYQNGPVGQQHVLNQPGFAHIAFSVSSVVDARAELLAAGASPLGQIVTTTIATGEKITWCYVTDPEGNIIELQSGKL
jgi:catechol 2,3-dioxygenase-like lactoylglutathione lyase family enzyme